MNSKQFTESTTSGAIASVPTPVGKTQTRGEGVYPNEKGGNLLTGKKTNKKHPNSVSESEKLKGTPVVDLKDFDDEKDYTKNKYGRTVPKKMKKDDPRIKFYKDGKEIKEAKLDEEDVIIVPGQGNRIKPGFIPRDKDRTDHEVEMAKSDLFQANKNAKKIYELIKDIPESVGLEGWVQEKIIKANDYLNTVREYLEHKQVSEMTGGVIAGGGIGEGIVQGSTYDSRKPYGVRYKVFSGKEGRLTTKEYWTTSPEKLGKAVAKIEAMDNFYEIDGYAGPDMEQSVSEGSENNFVQSNLEVWYKGRFAGWTTGKVYDDPYGKDGKMVAFKPNSRQFPGDEDRILALPHSEISLRKPTSIGKLKGSGQGVAEASDISGLMTAASMVKDYIVTAEVDGVVKKFRIRGVTGPQAAKERFLKHASMAKVLKVEEQGMAEGEEQGTKMNKNCSRCGDSLFRFSNTIKCHKCNQTWKASPKNKENQGVAEGTENSIEKKIKAKQDSLSLAREQRRAKGQRLQGQREIKLQAEIDRLNSELAQMKKQGLNENAEELSIGDPVIITGTNVKYQGATGEIVDFGTNNRFVVVNLYNHGRHSFHSSDVSYNEYADSDKEEAEMYDRDEDFRRWSSTQDIDEGIMGKVLGGAALLAALWGIGQNQAQQVYSNSPQLQTLIKYHQMATQQGDQAKIQELERRIENHKTRLSLGKGEVMGPDDKPIVPSFESSVIKGMTDESSYRTIRKVRSELKSEDDLIPSNKPELKGIYFFNNVTPELAKKYSKMKQYKNNKWGIPVYTTSGATTQNAITLATKEFGPHTYWEPKPKSFGESKCPECGGKLVAESELNEEGNKDACYHKVKSRYKVWPSAYASGALVKCRKVGAKNWGNKSK